jgi:conjugal transfer pilus assembly protein TrbC
MDALPQPATSTPVDIEAIAHDYARIEKHKTVPGFDKGPALLVFVSLDMPQAALTRLLDQVERAQARILVRGLKNGSFRETAAHIQQLIGARKAVIQIDPRAFERYAISRVPSFVLERANAGNAPCAGNECAVPGDAAKVAGDVSLQYALEHIERHSPAHRADAAHFLARLKR